MSDRDLDDFLERASEAPHPVDPAVLDNILKSIGPSMRPVRPLPSGRVLASGLFSICLVAALGGAVALGLAGIRALSASQAGVIFPVLGILSWMAAVSTASQIVPASPQRVSARWVPAICIITLALVFAVLFQDYHVEDFVHRGLVCLAVGLGDAALAGVGAFLVVRRGFAVDRTAAGLVTGALVGLAGIGMLELHCANLQAAHILVWHTAVVCVSGIAGALLSRRVA